MRKIDYFRVISFENHALDIFCTEVEQRAITTMNGKDTRVYARLRKCLKAYKAQLAAMAETNVETEEFIRSKVDLSEAYEIFTEKINALMITKRDPEYRTLAAQINELITATRIQNKAKAQQS